MFARRHAKARDVPLLRYPDGVDFLVSGLCYDRWIAVYTAKFVSSGACDRGLMSWLLLAGCPLQRLT